MTVRRKTATIAARLGVSIVLIRKIQRCPDDGAMPMEELNLIN